MSRYIVPELGTLQQRILKHFFECQDNVPETASHISKALNVLQPSVARSVNLLIKDGYLFKDKRRSRHGAKVVNVVSLMLTDKGAMAAVALGSNFVDIKRYFEGLKRGNSSAAEQVEILEKFEEMFADSSRRDFLIQCLADYALNNDLFTEGVFDLPPEKVKMLMTYLSIKYTKAFGRAQTVNDIVKKYGLDKRFLKEMWTKERKRLDDLIKHLE